MQYLVCYFFHFFLGRFGRQPQDSQELGARSLERMLVLVLRRKIVVSC